MTENLCQNSNQFMPSKEKLKFDLSKDDIPKHSRKTP